MNKRTGIVFTLGFSLLFGIGIYLQQETPYRVEASAELLDTDTDKPSVGLTDADADDPSVGLTDMDTDKPSDGPADDQPTAGQSTIGPDATGQPQPTAEPSATATPTPTATASPKPAKTPGAATRRDKPGWNKTAKGRKYYIKANGKRAKGYKTIDGDSYYFNQKGYAITGKWKYVRLAGKKYKLYFGKNGKRKLDVTKQLKKNTYFRIEVNLSKNMVMIYAKDGNKGYTIPVKAMVCSVGMPGHRTITGTYSRLRRAGNWHVLRYNSVGQYCTRISGPYLFHSVVYTRYGDHYSLQKAEYRKLGKSASHGCIRLQVKDAKWIYDRAYRCSVSLYYDKSAKYPLKKPKAEKIGKSENGRYYDPTDTKVNHE